MAAADFFQQHCAQARPGDALHLPQWLLAHWQALFSHAQILQVKAGESVVKRGELDRALFFVADGALEVAPSTGRADTLGALFRELPGSVFGEVSLFDGLPRSASVWAIAPSQLIKLSDEGLRAFTHEHPALANELLLALGRVLALRLRRREEKQGRPG